MEISYYANDWESAVIKVPENGKRIVKFFLDGILESEFEAHPDSKVAYGSQEIDLIKITEEEYNSFGKTWKFGKGFKKVKI
ncbi:MAG: hypothetical protein IPP61_11805 [Cytophagaceae bacterium]|nr:hypothetical protein [Cytophagaceae bacterium]